MQKVGSKTRSDLRAVYDYVWPLNHSKPRASPMHSLISPISPIQNVYIFPIFQCALTFVILGVRKNPWNLKLLSVLSRGSEIYSLIGANEKNPWDTLEMGAEHRGEPEGSIDLAFNIVRSRGPGRIVDQRVPWLIWHTRKWTKIWVLVRITEVWIGVA